MSTYIHASRDSDRLMSSLFLQLHPAGCGDVAQEGGDAHSNGTRPLIGTNSTGEETSASKAIPVRTASGEGARGAKFTCPCANHLQPSQRGLANAYSEAENSRKTTHCALKRDHKTLPPPGSEVSEHLSPRVSLLRPGKSGIDCCVSMVFGAEDRVIGFLRMRCEKRRCR